MKTPLIPLRRGKGIRVERLEVCIANGLSFTHLAVLKLTIITNLTNLNPISFLTDGKRLRRLVIFVS